MDNPPKPSFTAARLPWIVAAGAFVLFLATLNHWVSLASLGFVAKVTGWDWWSPTLEAPFLLVLTYPVRWLPAGAQPIALNLLTAGCAAATLGILARSVALLPHDRTKEQRALNFDPRSLLATRWAWAPVVFAVLACALELTFWEHATAASGEVVSLLLFAAVVWCLLEFRIGKNQRWLDAFALIYGVSIANNWAMLGFFPFFAVALIWIKGLSFFRVKFIGRIAAFGAIGGLFYLVLPIAATIGDGANTSFWQSLRTELGTQKHQLLQYPKGRALLLSLTSIVPMFFMGIRWTATSGDSNALSNRLTTLTFHILHALFLVGCAAVTFDLAFSPRALGYGLAFLPFYYLGALAIGYFSGYLLLVFGEESPNAWERPKGIFKIITKAIVVLTIAASLGVPTVLLLRNAPTIQTENGPALREFANSVAQSVNLKNLIVLSDDPAWLLLATAANPDLAKQNLLIHRPSLAVPVYHQMLHKRAPVLWPDWFGGKLPTNSISQAFQTQAIARLSRTNSIFQLHSVPGIPLLEAMQARPAGLASRLVMYPNVAGTPAAAAAAAPRTKAQEALLPAPLTAQEIAYNLEFWNRIAPAAQRAGPRREGGPRSTAIVSSVYSQAMNAWGVELQRAGMLDDAAPHFIRALKVNPDNASAETNLEVNRRLKTAREKATVASAATDAKFARRRTWPAVLAANGPIDEPRYCTQIGESFSKLGLPRQAGQQFLRATTLDSEAFEPRAGLIDIFTQVRLPDLALDVIRETRTAAARALEAPTNQVSLACLEAAALFNQTNFTAAEKILNDAFQKFPRDTRVTSTMTKLYIFSRQWTNAVASAERELSQNSDNQRALLNLGAALLELKQHEQALAVFDRLLRMRPEHSAALLNRSIALLNLNRLDAAQRDCETLVRIEPTMNSGLLGLAQIALRRQRTNDAVNYFEQARRITPPGSLDAAAIDKQLKELKGQKP
jgi:tetratricopeptide (TPR) repeat protein